MKEENKMKRSPSYKHRRYVFQDDDDYDNITKQKPLSIKYQIILPLLLGILTTNTKGRKKQSFLSLVPARVFIIKCALFVAH